MNMVIKFATAAAVVAVLPALAACTGSRGAEGRAAVTVVASTDVYGDIARQVAGRLAGDRVAVQSIISGPSVDPHSFEAGTRTELAISRADVVIENGGGYDPFVDAMRHVARRSATVINVVKLSGKQASDGGELNEHVWYDLPTVGKLVDRIVAVLSREDVTDAAAFRANGAAFTHQLEALERRAAAIKAVRAGDGVAVTEPVPLYLLEACGLVNRMPEAFSAAIEEGSDVPPRLLRQALALFSGHEVHLLAYNEQTSGSVTEKLLAAARTNHVAVVPVTETLPEHDSYLTWMSGNLTAIESALGGT